MGTTLTGTKPKDTYDSLIKVTDNGPISGTAKYLSDGLGNDLPIAVSTSNVGIGTSTPVSKLNVNGVITASAGAQSNPTGGASIVVDYQTTSDLQGRVRSRDWDGGLWKNLRLEGENIIVSPSGTERVRVTANGLTFNGDTAAANALDDYEEGTWTMGIAFGGASVGVTYANTTGTYTKIGRQVTVNGFLRLSNKGSSTGGAKITGLPFTVGNVTGNLAGAALRFDTITFTNQFMGHAEDNSTTIALEEITTLGAVSTLTNADFADSCSIIVGLTYFV
jgi:hypothetical protein